ncbi:multiple epidermal growth factor-like domains protein [Anaeramoeba flamelloides]|uniref:Multiple epidermal growth factor-like domains protein n=1 Tax=Anaeramoeba flamelloides TaxID=1746091 RepID=A0ABQ8Y8H4_9EUKA|nr:multiple epidermal growth factor-like domains protein [Anaeramoeba flamelloides]
MNKIIQFFALLFFLQFINCSYTGQCDGTSATCTIQLETATLLPASVSFDNSQEHCPYSESWPAYQLTIGCDFPRLNDRSASLVSYYDNTDVRCDGQAEYGEAEFCTGTHFMRAFDFQLPTMFIDPSAVYPEDDDIKKQTQSVTMTGANFYVNHGDWERKGYDYWDTDLNWELFYYDNSINGMKTADHLFRNWDNYQDASEHQNAWADGQDRVLEYDTLESLIGDSGDSDLWHAELLNHNGFGIKGNAWYKGKGDTYADNKITEKLAYRLKYIKMQLKYQISITALSLSPQTGYNNTELTITFEDYTVLKEGPIGQTDTDKIDWKVKFVKGQDTFIFDAKVFDHKSIKCKITEDRIGETFDVYVKFLENADWLKVPVAFTYADECPMIDFMNCDDNGACQDGTVTCNCYQGWVDDDCSVQACSGLTCENDKECSIEDGKCQCGVFFSGVLCDYDICANDFDNCNNENGQGECKSINNQVMCDCETGFGGKNCEVSYCENNECSKHGTCTDGNCQCDLPYYGENCESDDCNGTFEGCSGNGDVNVACHCACHTGWSGDQCQDNWCDGVTCNYHGGCKSETGVCDCETGYSGDDCEDNWCEGVTCNDHGSCKMSTGTCECQTGYSGDNCEDFWCDGVSCNDHGSCNTETGVCDCETGYTGDNCEPSDVTSSATNFFEISKITVFFLLAFFSLFNKF